MIELQGILPPQDRIAPYIASVLALGALVLFWLAMPLSRLLVRARTRRLIETARSERPGAPGVEERQPRAA